MMTNKTIYTITAILAVAALLIGGCLVAMAMV
jgi:hypothetical protein